MADEIDIGDRYSWWRPQDGSGRRQGEDRVEAPPVYDVYARLSYNLRGEKESTPRQIEDCTSMARRMGLPLGETHADDDISAWRDGVVRPGWEALLTRIEARQIKGVVIWHPDRLMRKPKDLLRLIEAADAGLVIHSCGGQRDLTNPDDRRALWYEIIHADSSSQDTSRRVKAGLADAAAKGRPAVGRRGYGYGVPTGVLGPDGREIVDKRRIVEEEAKVVREAAGRILAGESMNSITNDLADRGVPTLRGGRWKPHTLRVILSSPRIAGLRIHRGRVVGAADWPPIIERGRWEELQAAMRSRGAAPRKHPEREYLASGLAVCGMAGCGARLQVKAPWEGWRPSERRYARTAAVYYCRRGTPYGGCGRLQIQAAGLDAHLAARLRALAADPAALDAAEGGSGGRDADAAELARVEADLTGLAQRWRTAGGARRMSLGEYAELRAGLADRRDELEARLAGRDRPSPSAVAGGLLWDGMDYARRRAFARALVDAVVVAPPVRRGGPFDSARVEIRWR